MEIFLDVSCRGKKKIGLSRILYGLNQKWPNVRSLQLWYRNFIYHQKEKELLHAEIRTGLTTPFPRPAFVRVFQRLGTVIYSVTLPKPWKACGNDGARPHGFFLLIIFFCPALVQHQAQGCPGPEYYSDSHNDADNDKENHQGKVCREKRYIFFKATDIFEKIRQLWVTWAPLQVWNSSTRLQSYM